ncbi:lipopolysaccharide biosynthesis protein [Methanoregula sp.]|uniref:lipopolysaccharide biosynthesis protein n=1 Tax=Methanoregula sp. TaxID=2052170 RepID=UPI003C75A56A
MDKPLFRIIDYKNPIVIQTLSLYSSTIIALILGVFTGIINTRMLGPEGYGILAFFGAITGFTVLFFRFGSFSAAGVLLAQCKDDIKSRELTGASIVLAFIIGIFYSCFIFFISFYVDTWFHVEIGWILRWASFMLVALPMTLLIPQIGRGMNAIHRLSIFNILQPLLYLGGAFLLLFSVKIEPVHLILLNMITTVIAIFVVIYTFHPLFSHLRETIGIIHQKTKEYGFQLYIGQIADQSTTQLNGLIIPLFINTTQLGFFSLAMMITTPIAGLSQSLSISLFRNFAQLEEIPKKVIYYNAAWLIMCAILLNVFGGFIIGLLLSKAFLPVVPLLLPMSIAVFFQGMYQPYNLFLGAKLCGKWLRNISIIECCINVAATLLLIPLFGTFGAALAILCGYSSFYFGSLYYYKKYRSQLQ